MSDVEVKLSGEKDRDNLIQSFKGIVYGLTPISISDLDTEEVENESKYSAELDEIFTQLHEADDYISETRQNTTRLRVETRSMLNDLRKQLG
jgi:hypothetical protein